VKVFYTILGVGLLLYMSLGLVLFLLQRTFIYFPSPVVSHGFAEKTVSAADGVSLKVIVIKEAASEAIVYFGGNAESVALSASELAAAFPGKSIYLVNYRGYGGSEGSPSEADLFSDAEQVYKFAAGRHATVSVIGRSLGSGVAMWLASRLPVERVALITPFDSILNVAKGAYPMFPVRWLLRDHFNSEEYAPQVTQPVLVILAQFDEVIPAARSRQLIHAFPREVQVSVLSGTGHNDVQTHADYYLLLREFFN
jgi:pimeloyl-ACP methyl ester carboxylesterase